MTVFGHPFLGAARRPISIDAITARCLCEGHNGGFSPVDDAAIDAFNALRELHRFCESRKRPLKTSHQWNLLSFTIDGIGLERWAFKTTCSMAFVMKEESGGWMPPPQLVRYALGLEAPPKDVGLAAMSDLGDRIGAIDLLEFAFLRDNKSKDVRGSMFRFRGLAMVCTWECPVSALLPLEFEDVQGRSALWHPNRLLLHPQNVQVRFDWSRDFMPSAKTKALRKRYPGVPR